MERIFNGVCRIARRFCKKSQGVNRRLGRYAFRYAEGPSSQAATAPVIVFSTAARLYSSMRAGVFHQFARQQLLSGMSAHMIFRILSRRTLRPANGATPSQTASGGTCLNRRSATIIGGHFTIKNLDMLRKLLICPCAKQCILWHGHLKDTGRPPRCLPISPGKPFFCCSFYRPLMLYYVGICSRRRPVRAWHLQASEPYDISRHTTESKCKRGLTAE